MSIEELESEVMKLDPEQRARLGEKLLGSVPATLDLEEEWVKEVDRRMEQIRSGAVKPVSSRDMFREALESLE